MVLKKCQRVAEGQKQLASLGLADYARAPLRRLLPSKSCPVAPGWSGRVTVRQKLGIVAIGNYIRWMNFFTRIRGR